jgi:hypothetical protein
MATAGPSPTSSGLGGLWVPVGAVRIVRPVRRSRTTTSTLVRPSLAENVPSSCSKSWYATIEPSRVKCDVPEQARELHPPVPPRSIARLRPRTHPTYLVRSPSRNRKSCALVSAAMSLARAGAHVAGACRTDRAASAAGAVIEVTSAAHAEKISHRISLRRLGRHKVAVGSPDPHPAVAALGSRPGPQ